MIKYTIRIFLVYVLSFPLYHVVAQTRILDKGLSDGDWELSISISKDDSLALISKFAPFTFFVKHRMENRWGESILFPYTGAFEDGGADFMPDGRSIIFSSRRPVDAQVMNSSSDLWRCNFDRYGWSAPAHLGDKINSDEDELSPSVAKSGHIYLMKNAEDGMGGYDLYVSYFNNGQYGTPVNLGPNINSSYNEEDPFIDPDERYLVFMSQRPGDVGTCNLYISLNTAQGWTEAKSLGPDVNTKSCEYSPFVSNNKWLYFISYGTGVLDGKRKTYGELSRRYRQVGNGKPDIFRVNWNAVLEGTKIE